MNFRISKTKIEVAGVTWYLMKTVPLLKSKEDENKRE